GAAVGADEDGRPLYKVDPTCSCNFAGGCPDCLSYTQPANQGAALTDDVNTNVVCDAVIAATKRIVAARVAAERERIAQAIEADSPEGYFDGDVAEGYVIAQGFAARIAREGGDR